MPRAKRKPVSFVRFDAVQEDANLITAIVLRAASLMSEDQMGERLSLAMDITAVHLNDAAIDLAKLLRAPDFDFVHDVAGIVRHIDRRTGKLGNHFFPRCAKPETTHA